MKHKFIHSGLLMILVIAFGSFIGKAEKPTNFIIIYLDDVGYGDIALTGAVGYSTPNLDKMAASGMFFSHYYSPQAVCSASRAGLLTGCYPNRVGFHGALDHSAKTGINTDEETIAEVLKRRVMQLRHLENGIWDTINNFYPLTTGSMNILGFLIQTICGQTIPLIKIIILHYL